MYMRFFLAVGIMSYSEGGFTRGFAPYASDFRQEEREEEETK